MAVMNYLLKLRRGLTLAFGAYFRRFCHKNVTYFLILCLLTNFQCNTFFPSQDIKQNVLLSSYLDN